MLGLAMDLRSGVQGKWGVGDNSRQVLSVSFHLAGLRKLESHSKLLT